MGSRIAATMVLVVAVAVLVWVTLGGNDTESATEQRSTAEPTRTATTDTPASLDEITDDEPEIEAPEIETPENFGPRMDLVDIDGWLNTDATSIDDFTGQVLLVEMWTFGCSNCKARIPFTQSYYEEFGDANFEILGVHAPEFSFEADVNNIIEAADQLGVNWPIALDTDKLNFRKWQPGSTNFWPRTYVIDQNGDIRYDHIGEGNYEELRETIRYLIDNPPAANPAT